MKRLSFVFVVVGFASANAQTSSGGSEITYQIPQMMCGSCTSRVTKSIQGHGGVSDVHVSLDDHTARFRCDAKAGCDEEKIRKDLSRIQYGPRKVSSKP